jgi:DNA-binding transcriptional LysR family regulator
MELLKEMAVAGKGTALLPRHFVVESLANGTLEVVVTQPMYRPIWAVSRKKQMQLSYISKKVDDLLAQDAI